LILLKIFSFFYVLVLFMYLPHLDTMLFAYVSQLPAALE
jgi:hypothetical protein